MVSALTDLQSAIEIYYNIYNKPMATHFLKRLKIYYDYGMYDYWENDIKELKSLIDLELFDSDELNQIQENLLNNYGKNLKSLLKGL